jgi:hypothetical protein
MVTVARGKQAASLLPRLLPIPVERLDLEHIMNYVLVLFLAKGG